MGKLVRGDKLVIVGEDVDFHGFIEGTEVSFEKVHKYPEFGYMVSGVDFEGIYGTIKVLEEHIEKVS